MKILINRLSIYIVLVCLLGCATGVEFTELAPFIQKLPENKGRIYFYRTETISAQVQPNIILNGEVVGKAIPNGFFYVDRNPGLYEILIESTLKNTRSFILEKGQTVYVRLGVAASIPNSLLSALFIPVVYSDIVDPEVGAKGIKVCRYTGSEN
jgi:hypothetical protein